MKEMVGGHGELNGKKIDNLAYWICLALIHIHYIILCCYQTACCYFAG